MYLPFSLPPFLSGIAQSFPVFTPLKISGTCPSRCPFMFRAIVKRHGITGSRLNRYAETGQPPGFGGDKSGAREEQPGIFPARSFYPAKKGDLIPALHEGDRPDIEILTLLFGILRPGDIHPSVGIPGLCKSGPEIHEIVRDRVRHRIRSFRDLKQ